MQPVTLRVTCAQPPRLAAAGGTQSVPGGVSTQSVGTIKEAARFSFLLGLPAIALAGLKELWVLLHADLPAHAWSHLLFGLVVASVSAFFAIWGLMKFLERFSTWPFVIYRALLGVFLIVAVSTGLLS